MAFSTTKIIPRRQWVSQYETSDQGLPTLNNKKNVNAKSTESMMNGYHLQNDPSYGHGNDPDSSHQNKSKFASRLLQCKLSRKRVLICTVCIVIVTFNGLQFKFSGLPARLQSFYTDPYSMDNNGQNGLQAEQQQQQLPRDRNLSGCARLTAKQQQSLKTRNLSGCELESYITPEQANMLLAIPDIINSDSVPEPTHITLCRELIVRNESMKKENAAVNPFLSKIKETGNLIVHETEEDCNDWKRPHSMLMQILSSAIIAYVGEPFGLTYNHNCYPMSTNLEFDVTTVQQVLTQNSILLNENVLSRGSVVYDLCQNCIDQENDPDFIEKRKMMKEQNIEDTHHCFLFPEQGDVHTGYVVEQEGDEASQQILDEEDNVIHTGLEAVLPLVRNRLWHLSLDRSPKAHIPRGDPTMGTVIYLDATQSLPIPFHLFSETLPNEATHVSIMTSPSCAISTLGDLSDVSKSCYSYGLGLKRYLEKKLPEIGISFDLVSSTATAYSRMIQTHFLVCPPGTITCLFPALAREKSKPTVVFESEIRPNTFHWFKYLALSTSNGVSATRGISISPLHNNDMVPDDIQRKIEDEVSVFVQDRVMSFGGDKSSNSGTTLSEQHNVDGVSTMFKSMGAPQSDQEPDSQNTAYESKIGEVRFGGKRSPNSGTPLSDQQNDFRARPPQDNSILSLPKRQNVDARGGNGASNGNGVSLPTRGEVSTLQTAGVTQEKVSSNPKEGSPLGRGEKIFNQGKVKTLPIKSEVSFSNSSPSTEEIDFKSNPEVSGTASLFGS